MSASMLDEVKVPAEPRPLSCPCCVLFFSTQQKFIDHLELMRARIDAALKTVKR